MLLEIIRRTFQIVLKTHLNSEFPLVGFVSLDDSQQIGHEFGDVGNEMSAESLAYLLDHADHCALHNYFFVPRVLKW